MSTDQSLVLYYKARAAEYEKIYSKPERQQDLNKASTILKARFANRSVCEIACGTGYWTERISQTAKCVHATDINQSVVEIGKTKDYGCPVTFEIADLYNLSSDKKYDSVFGGFIWSHILVQDLDKFIDKAAELVAPGGTIVFMDNKYVEGSNHPITRTDAKGNTFQTRKLGDGSSHDVLKNFPTQDFLQNKLSRKGAEVEITELNYFWIGCFKLSLGESEQAKH
jgi:2-polyprenyl-3-methyl-5-hydroxy-6-metoxy-1,4-benzoquinol methylase